MGHSSSTFGTFRNFFILNNIFYSRLVESMDIDGTHEMRGLAVQFQRKQRLFLHV